MIYIAFNLSQIVEQQWLTKRENSNDLTILTQPPFPVGKKQLKQVGTFKFNHLSKMEGFFIGSMKAHQNRMVGLLDQSLIRIKIKVTTTPMNKGNFKFALNNFYENWAIKKACVV